ncbi:MAG: MGMT family protein [Geobacter sp.]|nr:MGMT family protein [Geobacter sp.]
MRKPKQVSVSWYTTSQGRGAVATSTAGICRVWLPGDDLSGPEAARLPEDIRSHTAAAWFNRYFQGDVQPSELQVDISYLSLFYQQVLQLTMQIPYGSVTSYGALAVLAGRPRASRAVGGALRSNPVPIIIPCHRVVAASGALTGFSGPGGISMKKILLELEGVDMNGIKSA